MKYSDKKKLWLATIKEKRKSDNWKYTSQMIFKSLDNLFFSSTFYPSLKEDAISGWLAYKTMNIDNVFWDIIDEQSNKKRPLSFRGQAAFQVWGINFFHYNIYIEDQLNPDKEIVELLKNINDKVSEKINAIKTLADFQSDLLTDEERNSVGVITGYIEQGQIEIALAKIKEYKSKGYNPIFRFGDKDFYDLALEYCRKNYR